MKRLLRTADPVSAMRVTMVTASIILGNPTRMSIPRTETLRLTSSSRLMKKKSVVSFFERTNHFCTWFEKMYIS